MDWFKQNPFLGALVAAAALILLGGGFLVFSQAGRLDEEQAAFEEKKASLDRLNRGKPFPDAENLAAMQKESAEANELLAQIAGEFAVQAPKLTPQGFQDELSKLVKEITEMAAARGVTLPEDFYLGFESYETQPPSAETAPQLGLQLRAIHAVAKVLVESQVKGLGPIVRAPLPGEAGAPVKEEEEPEEKGRKKKPKEEAEPSFAMAPFDVNFTSDQSAFRMAFDRILGISPPVFVRLVAVTNSALTGPSKQEPAPEDAATPEAAAATTPGIRPVLGRETLTVDLRLASIAATAAETP